MEGVAFWAGFVGLVMGIALVIVVAMVSIRRRNDPAVRRLRETPEGRAAHARPGPVTLRGTVVPGTDGSVREPLSGHEVVWYRLTAFGPRAGQRSSNDYVEVHSERDARDFLVDDGSRAPARVSVDDAGFVVPMDMYGGVEVVLGADQLPWAQHRLTDQPVAVLRARCARPTTRIVRADLHALAPGAIVTVVGWLERVGGDPVVVGRPPDHPLIVYGVADDVLRRDRAERSTSRRVLAVVGLLMIAAGGCGLWWGRSTIGL